MSARYSQSIIYPGPSLTEQQRVDLEREGYRDAGNHGCLVAALGYQVSVRPPDQEWPWAEAFEHAYYVGVNASVNMLAYSHWIHGKLVRHLYFCDEWLRVVGQAEAWESDALFGPSALARFELYLADWDFENEDRRQSETQRSQRIYRDEQLEEGSEFPLCDAETVGIAIGKHIGL